MSANPQLRQRGGESFPIPTAKIGFWLFLAAITLLFSAVVSAYVVRSGLPDWVSLHEPGTLWLNTGLLALASVAFQWAVVRARRGRTPEVRRGMLVAGVLSLAFLVGQVLVWGQLVGLGYFLSSNPASTFFYLFTALHGLHVAGGLVAWGRAYRMTRGGTAARAVQLNVELCAHYWHYLLAVWVVLFGLMTFT